MRIGIDAGGSLIKLAYEEKGYLRVRKYNINEMTKLLEWLHLTVPAATLIGTGGNWPKLIERLELKSFSVDEFTALINGTKYLLETEKKHHEQFILTSIGTGTSIFHVSEKGFDRLLGSGIGGGTWVGLGALLTNAASFSELVEYASKGNHENNDLLVKDIYSSNENIPLLGSLTAANFGKAHLTNEKTAFDHAAALNQLIGEVILSLAGQAAASKNMKQIVFVGSTLEGNKPLKDLLKSFQQIMPYESVFLEKGAYAGAVGALIDG